MPAPFRGLARFLSPQTPLAMTPAARSQLVQQLLAQSQSPQGIVSPYGTANKALQGLLMRRANNQEQRESELASDRQQALAGALSRAGQEGPQGEAAKRAAMIISGGIPENPLARSLMTSQAQSIFGPKGNADLFGVVDPSDFTPESLKKFNQSKDYGDLVRIANNINRYTPSNYTPESWNKFIQTGDEGALVAMPNYRFQQSPSGAIVAGNTVTGQTSPTGVTPQVALDEAAARKRAEAEATATGEAIGKAQGMILSRAMNAEGINDVLDIAEPLIMEATGSGTGAGRDKLAAFFGFSTTGAQAIAQLLPLQAAIMLRQPRMEGPQSDRDVQLYREAAGQIGDPNVPRETKLAAIKTIRILQNRYKEAAAPAATGGIPDISNMSDEELKRLAGGNQP